MKKTPQRDPLRESFVVTMKMMDDANMQLLKINGEQKKEIEELRIQLAEARAAIDIYQQSNIGNNKPIKRNLLQRILGK